MRRIGGAVALAAIVGAAFVVTGLGQASRRATPTHVFAGQYDHVRVSAATVKHGIRLRYVYGSKTVQPGLEFDAPLTCPQHFRPISGGFDSNSIKTFMVTNRPEPPGVGAKNARKWSVGVTNIDTVAANIIAVVVCAQ